MHNLPQDPAAKAVKLALLRYGSAVAHLVVFLETYPWQDGDDDLREGLEGIVSATRKRLSAVQVMYRRRMLAQDQWLAALNTAAEEVEAAGEAIHVLSVIRHDGVNVRGFGEA